jgi:hypothetical protein
VHVLSLEFYTCVVDTVPICGRRRRPYMVSGVLVEGLCWILLSTLPGSILLTAGLMFLQKTGSLFKLVMLDTVTVEAMNRYGACPTRTHARRPWHAPPSYAWPVRSQCRCQTVLRLAHAHCVVAQRPDAKKADCRAARGCGGASVGCSGTFAAGSDCRTGLISRTGRCIVISYDLW